jgi:hypothetical protein
LPLDFVTYSFLQVLLLLINVYCLFIGKIVKIHTSRLLLCEATANIIAAGFHILGIDPLEKM